MDRRGRLRRIIRAEVFKRRKRQNVQRWRGKQGDKQWISGIKRKTNKKEKRQFGIDRGNVEKEKGEGGDIK